MKSKKFLALLLVLVMAISVLASCKPAEENQLKNQQLQKKEKKKARKKLLQKQAL